MKRIVTVVLFLIAFVVYAIEENPFEKSTTSNTNIEYDKVIDFPEDRYPGTAAHIKHAVENGKSPICTINRKGAEENRDESLKGIPTKSGYDRDEFPMAFCEEGGKGADIEYVKPSDNRGAGSWISHQVDDLENGTKVLIQVQ
ncbi:NucA/NucB deoxyribonuclease domain-containing protein [Priestia endophytica]|uniref:Deoxyribonuclease NucA/NucB n=1 Tax=Priestia endophytica DSM 13796 TaxID=1121089 RepID=A0A1I6C7A1_9BACI|nr:NucA/NucB deoxyribonuclease domain-containing protein [Priestia endophytica]KYG33499.1 DNA-entry nuclease [Priestia endophytica]SFQ89051.1 Deoxyribonuclease NucA/NucB [Priestia endophytica DSM 13796]